MILLDVLLSVFASVLLFRAGLPSPVPILLFSSLVFGYSLSPFVVLGFVSVYLVWLNNSFSHSETFLSDFLIGMGFALVGLAWVSVFGFPSLDFLVVPSLLLVFCFLFFSFRKNIRLFVFASFLCLALGWLSLVRWVIPHALLALLVGFFGASFQEAEYAPFSLSPYLGGFVGVFLGFLPGLGPGILSLAWPLLRGQLSVQVSNLVFSLGFILLTGRVRSVPASFLGGVEANAFLVFGALLASLLVARFFFSFFSAFSFPHFSREWGVASFVLLGFTGGFSTVGLGLLAFCLRAGFVRHGISQSLGLLVLFPSLILFYG